MSAIGRLQDQIPEGYQRPLCPYCHRVMGFVHFNPGGSRYACLPCEFNLPQKDSEKVDPQPDRRSIRPGEASWIIRHGITTPESRSKDGAP